MFDDNGGGCGDDSGDDSAAASTGCLVDFYSFCIWFFSSSGVDLISFLTILGC